MADGKIIPGLNHKTIDLDVNLFLLPNIDDMKTEGIISNVITTTLDRNERLICNESLIFAGISHIFKGFS